MSPPNWRLIDYLVHRWISTALGALVLAWFASGIVMIYYPWPRPTPSAELGRLEPLTIPGEVIGYDSAARVAGGEAFSGARITMWNGRAVYTLWRRQGATGMAAAIVEASSGRVLSPISREEAIGVARTVVGAAPSATEVDRLADGDLYLLSNEYRREFPAYRVHFDDPARTMVYVGTSGGRVIGVVTRLTRWTTWFGTVPHWLYIKWLYTRHLDWWLWLSYLLPAITMVGGIAGVAYGLRQSFPRRESGDWTVTIYRGVTKWHHLAGIAFGFIVITWSLSGILEVLGPDGSPSEEQVTRTQGKATTSYTISPGAIPPLTGSAIVAIDATRLLGRAVYVARRRTGQGIVVDAADGSVRGELDSARAVLVATAALGAAPPVLRVDRLTAPDLYYYARPHREVALPVWRVAFADSVRSTIYLDALSGQPVGFVDAETRWYRWLRDGLHGFDLPALMARRPLWDLLLLVFLLGGTISAVTGLLMTWRRYRPRPPRHSD